MLALRAALPLGTLPQVSIMARPRFPAPYAIFQLVLRFISVGICVATIASASYVASHPGYGARVAGAFVAVCQHQDHTTRCSLFTPMQSRLTSDRPFSP